jgi:uncharacterized protein with PIN domain
MPITPKTGSLFHAETQTDLGKQLGQMPERMDALEKRLAALEVKLEQAPGERCDGCGELALRLESSRIVGEADHKYTKLKWKCTNCGKTFEERE